MDSSATAHELCEHIEKCGGTVRLDQHAFNQFCQILLDYWEDGFRCGQETPDAKSGDREG